MAGDIGYANERFSRAVRALAFSDDPYRERLERALAEALHNPEHENPRSIPDELRHHINFFFGKFPCPIASMTDDEADSLGEELLDLASEIDRTDARTDD
jgi:hypothetical protein